MPSQLYIGIMSGTSADGIDAALVDFSNPKAELVCNHFTHFDELTRSKITALFTPSNNEIDRMGELDAELGKLYLDAAKSLLSKAGVNSNDIQGLGLHGQTIRHRPEANHPFTLQIGNPYLISHKIGITTVNDFRRADMTMGGQGAPLAPLFHRALFHSSEKNRVIINLGGIANITYLKADRSIEGFDTGPGNGLMDSWIESQKGVSFDQRGEWAASGKTLNEMLNDWLSDGYYSKTPPKSTGKEYFTLDSVGLNSASAHAPEDIQRTLCELTARSVVDAINKHCLGADELYVCGGGAFNDFLMARIAKLSRLTTQTTEALGIAPDWVEAVGFAWLAKACLAGDTLDTQSVTGASTPCILGAIHPAI